MDNHAEASRRIPAPIDLIARGDVVVPRRVFLSYGHDEHSALALRLKQDLESRGHDVWFDLDRLKAGVEWEQYIDEGLERVSATPGEGRFLLLMTPHSVRRPDGYCLNELDRALRRKLRVVPLMVVRCEPPLSICRLQYLDVEDCLPLEQREERYQLKLRQLLDALEHDTLDFEGVHGRLVRHFKPLSFDAELQEHTARFTGRQWVLDRIAHWLADSAGSRVFWITGEPGLGKTAMACWLCLHSPHVAAFHLCRHGLHAVFRSTVSRRAGLQGSFSAGSRSACRSTGRAGDRLHVQAVGLVGVRPA